VLNSSTLNSDQINGTSGSGSVTTAQAARLYPLRESCEYDQVEAELKRLFIALYEQLLLKDADDLNVYGTAHLGSFKLVERFVQADGLALIRNNDDGAMRYLYRAWRARNSGRGLHFLRTYLQLLWPNAWELSQLWQDRNEPYPTKLRTADPSVQSVAGHYLTSRLQVGIEDESETGAQIARIAPALRAVISAKFVLAVVVVRKIESTLRFAGAMAGTSVMIAEFDCAPGMPESGLDFAGVYVAKNVMLADFDMRP
jgi:hypothetical protein